MATSGSTNFTSTRDDIIGRALRIVGRVAVGNTLNATEVSNAAEALEMLVKSLQTLGIRLWTRDWITSPRQSTGNEATNGGSNWTCIRPHTSGSSTEPGVGADSSSYWVLRGTSGSAWANSAEVTNGGINYKCKLSLTSAAADEPGVGANWQTYWEIGGDGSDGGWVTSTAYIGTTYTAANTFSLDNNDGLTYFQVDEAWVRQSQTDTPLERISFEEYLNIYQKDSEGRPNMYAVQEGLSTPVVYLHPFPDSTEIIVNMLAVRRLEDFDSAGTNPDFPVEWFNVLVWGLADEMGDEYHLPIEERERITRKYNKYLSAAKKDDQQDYSRYMASCYS